MAAQDKPEVNNKILAERARALADLIRKVRATPTVNRQMAVAMESVLPGLLPKTMPVNSFTESDSPTNQKELLELLNRQYSEVVFEAFHVASSKGESVGAWVVEAANDEADLRGAAAAIEHFEELFKPAAETFMAFLESVRSSNAPIFASVIEQTNLMKVADTVDATIEAALASGVLAAIGTVEGRQRAAIFEWNRIFRNKEVFPEALDELIEDAEENLFERDGDAAIFECEPYDEFREYLGFQDTATLHDTAHAYLFMVERLLEEKVNVKFDLNKHLTKATFDFATLCENVDYADVYTELKNRTTALFDKVMKEYHPDIDHTEHALGYAGLISDAWAAVETSFRAQSRLYLEAVRQVYVIQSALVTMAGVMATTAERLRDANETAASALVIELNAYIRATGVSQEGNLF